MIFYLAIDQNGLRQLRGTQADAAKVNKTFEQIDVPTDKPGLMAALQELLTAADTAGSPQTVVGDLAGIPVTATEGPDGVTLSLYKGTDAAPEAAAAADQVHSGRCPAAHRRLLTATEAGAKSNAVGEDMTVLTTWIEDAPEWAVDQVERAINARKNTE